MYKKKHFTFHHYWGAFCQGAFVLFPILTSLNTIKIIIICFNIPYFTTVVIVHSKFSLCSKIVSGNNRGCVFH